ncbi:hypothetical protein SAMN02910356_00317 [Selenomonas sp. GACV-9]|uniref:hypothetical protein n=1 Tax=Selenomonas sp. GACV-9 TaxID=3158782 RepID=UPI0008F1C4DA|nr:hypothetical protein SAMN02910356_00317 [Selenomonas ruminantium]
MKTKLISLLTILMLTLSGTCLAADWQWTKSNADVGFFFDKETVRYGMTNGQIDKDKIYVWLRAVLDDAYAQKKNRSTNHPPIKTTTSKYLYNTHYNTIQRLKIFGYAKSGSILFRNEQQKPPFELIPDTLMDDTMHAVKQYAHNHDKEITERTQKHSN